MRTTEELLDYLMEQGHEGSVVLTDDCFTPAVIGVTPEGRVVYDYDMMVENYMLENDCDYDDAVEWIEYNTIRSLPYAGDKGPIVMHPIEE